MFSTFIGLLALAGAVTAAPTERAACNAQARINYAKMVPYAYSQPGVTATYEAFSRIPFGVPDLNGPCVTVM